MDVNTTTTIPHDPSVKTYPFSEVPLSKNFRNIYSVLKAKGILGELTQRELGFDVPQFYVYACARSSGKKNINISYGFGGDEDETRAAEHSIAEAIEHYCILHEDGGKFIRGSFNELKSRAVDPLMFVPFTKEQLADAKYRKFIVTHKTPLNWVWGKSLKSNKKVLIPPSLLLPPLNPLFGSIYLSGISICKLYNKIVLKQKINTYLL